jgi:FkbM family methyltransferase
LNKYHIKQLIGNKDNITVFEIGAADFIDSAEFVETFKDNPNFKLYCFEPDSRNIAVFYDRIKDSRVSLFEGVVGNVDGEVTFHASTKNPQGVDVLYCGSLREPGSDLFKIWPELFRSPKDFVPMKVQSIKLDTFLENNNIECLDFIWMDVQGCEDIVIEGGSDTFKNKVRYLYTEYSNQEIYKGNPNLNKILSMLPDFDIVQDFGGDILLKNRNLN